MIQAEVICDSLHPTGQSRLTTIEVEFPRFILSEFNTHRVFSRSSASSRAIPVSKTLQRIQDDPYVPVFWGGNQKGMQASLEEIDQPQSAMEAWFEARDAALKAACELHSLGLHKQWANRLLEPFMWHKVIVTSSEWKNFFNLRCSPLAQPEMQATAEAMRDALKDSTPKQLDYGQYHLPYIQESDWIESDPVFIQGQSQSHAETVQDQLKRVSAARCARVSYLTHDGVRDLEKDLELAKKLAQNSPPHASPFEHIATPYDSRNSSQVLQNPIWNSKCGNLSKWWIQMRHQEGM